MISLTKNSKNDKNEKNYKDVLERGVIFLDDDKSLSMYFIKISQKKPKK